MSIRPTKTTQVSVAELALRARRASRQLARLSEAARNDALLGLADALEQAGPKILAANQLDCDAAAGAVRSGAMSSAMFARLRMKEASVAEMATRLRDVAKLPDPIGQTLSITELDTGLVLHKESCPLGVIGIVFESRPDVIPQVASLALKSGNAVLLKGGSEAWRTNEALVDIWREALTRFPAVPADSILLLRTRTDVMELLTRERDVDLIVPRGSQAFVRMIAQQSRIPVLGHGEGICHVYIDRQADIDKALRIVLDSKTQYPAACNAVETVLVHQELAKAFMPRMVDKLRGAGVAVRGCTRSMALAGSPEIARATDADWETEYSDLVLSVKVVADIDEATTHIDRYGSRHTETIVTEDREAAQRFMEDIDAAGVYHNASTRFADGYRYGLGAEVGISTSKLHARGPVGLDGLTTYKYKLFGEGQIVAEYASGEKQFHHRRIS
jgi:glutamate-5-semialdehyde dehydrogenase